MVKFALLVSATDVILTLEIRIRAVVDAPPVTVHGSVPSLAVLANSVVGNVDPPSVERSIFTFPVRLADVHVSACDDPITHVSPPFGDVTVMLGCTMLKFALLVSPTLGIDTLLIRIRTVLLTGPLTVHGSVPSLAVLAAIVVGNVDPPSVERSIFTFPVRFADDHVNVCDEPIAHDSPPFGDATVSVGCTIVKLALLLSRTVGSVTLTTRTRAVVLTGPLTVHGSVPSLAVLANSVVGKLAPPSVERSTFTFPLTPLDVHAIVCDEPIAQLSAPFGELTVIDGPPGVIVSIEVPVRA
jgi:hypothetical protein